MGFKEWYKERDKATTSKKDYEPSNKTTSSGFKDWYTTRQTKFDLAKGINFETLQNDLATLTKTIQSGYSGWQSRETMESALPSIQSMYDRLGKYQEYQKLYGGADLSELHTMYKSVLDDWEGLSREYSKHKDANSYNSAIESAKKILKQDFILIIMAI